MTIADDLNDVPPGMTLVGPSGGSEGDRLTFAAVLSEASGRVVTVDWGVADDSATRPADYTAAVGMLTIPVGRTRVEFEVVLVDDAMDEDEETFTVSLSGASNAMLGVPREIAVTIAEDVNDVPPTMTLVGPSRGSEGDRLTFEAVLSEASGRAVTVDWGVADDSATRLADYTAADGTGSPSRPGSRGVGFEVVLVDDDRDEDEETFTVSLIRCVERDAGFVEQVSP